MKPVREEITKTEWAVCQLYLPSKRTFGACYWVAPEQKWTSLDSEVVLSAGLPCDLPQWGRDGEGRGWTIHRTGNKYPSWGKLLAVFFFSAVQEEGKWQYISFRKWVRNTVLSPGETGNYTFNWCCLHRWTCDVLKWTLGLCFFLSNPGACKLHNDKQGARQTTTTAPNRDPPISRGLPTDWLML